MSTEETKKIIDLYLKEVGQKHDKNASIKFKKQSWVLRFVRPILELFNKYYWDDYITTLGSTVYVPDDWFEQGDIKSRLEIIAHEVIHIIQAKKQTSFVHGLLYLFPQSLGLFSLLALLAIPFGLGWLWSLLFLLCLAPLPAPFRYMKEIEAYRVRILFFKYAYYNSPELIKWAKQDIVKYLSKSDYYFCWPFPKAILKDLNKTEEKFDKEFYQEILTFLERHGLLSELPTPR